MLSIDNILGLSCQIRKELSKRDTFETGIVLLTAGSSDDSVLVFVR